MRSIAALGLLVAISAPSQARAVETKGQLNIVSQPGVEVVWEGVPLGNTDSDGLLVIEGIPPGSYDLVLRKAGYQDSASRVDVAEGSQSRRMLLERPPASVPAPVSAHEAQTEPPREPELTTEQEAALSAGTPGATSAARLDEIAIEPSIEPNAETTSVGIAASTEAAPTTVPPATVPQPTLPSTQDPETAAPVPAQTADTPIAGTAGTSDSDRAAADVESKSSSLPPMVYLLGLALLGTTGALAVQHRRRVRARAEPPPDQEPLVLEPPRNRGGATPSFLGDIKRREVAMDDILGTGSKRVRRDLEGSDDIHVEVIDLGPVEDDT